MAHKLAVVSVYAPHDRAKPYAVRRGGPVPALHATILYTRPDGTLGRCRVNDVAWSYYPDGSTVADVYTEFFLADATPRNTPAPDPPPASPVAGHQTPQGGQP